MSRPTDMGISYYLRSDVTGDVKVRIYNGSRMITELDGPKDRRNQHRALGSQARRERIQGEAVAAGRGGRGGGGGGGGRRRWRSSRWRRRASGHDAPSNPATIASSSS